MSKLMIVDDDRTTVSLLRMLLELDGHQVVATMPQAAVMGEILAERPDLVLLDVFLQDADGIEVLKQIRAEAALAGTRVVMISGMDVSDQVREAGADGFLLKPYTPDQLSAIIQENLNRSDPGH
jgi:DNA-binding response OmpR family regulator